MICYDSLMNVNNNKNLTILSSWNVILKIVIKTISCEDFHVLY